VVFSSEDYLFLPYRICSQCKGLAELGWIEDARAAASDMALVGNPLNLSTKPIVKQLFQQETSNE
jgi:hypothetical protein